MCTEKMLLFYSVRLVLKVIRKVTITFFMFITGKWIPKERKAKYMGNDGKTHRSIQALQGPLFIGNINY